MGWTREEINAYIALDAVRRANQLTPEEIRDNIGKFDAPLLQALGLDHDGNPLVQEAAL